MPETEQNKQRRVYGLRSKIEDFFDRNPTELLTREDMRIKFGCGLSTLDRALSDLRLESKIVSTLVIGKAPRS